MSHLDQARWPSLHKLACHLTASDETPPALKTYAASWIAADDSFNEWAVPQKFDSSAHLRLRSAIDLLESLDRAGLAAWRELCELRNAEAEGRFMAELGRAAAMRWQLQS